MDNITLAIAKSYVDDKISGVGGVKGDKGEDGKSAYQYAQDGGYTGTEEEFSQMLANGGTGGSGSSGGGETETTTHGIVWDLVNVTSSNNTVSIADGSSLVAVLTPTDGYTLGDVTVTMGGEALTGVWNADTSTVVIASVTEDVIISCVGVASDETGTVTLADTADFINYGFVRPTGVETIREEGTGSYYRYTDYLYVGDCTSITIDCRSKTTAVSPAVWYDADKVYLSGEELSNELDLNVNQVNTFVVPEGAIYVRSSAYIQTGNYATVTAERIGATDEPDADIPATSTESNTVYISPTGDDSNTGLSADSPVATFTRAKTVGGTNGTLVWMEGDYWQPEGVNLGAFAKMRTNGTVRLIYYDNKFDSAELIDGYTRVYGVACESKITKSLWQHDVPDVRTEIDFSERHPLHRDRTYRLPSTRIVSVTNVDSTSTDTTGYLTTMENTTDNYLHYYDADAQMLYFTAPDSDFATHPIIKGISSAIMSATREVHIHGINFLYTGLSVGSLSGVLEEVSVLGGYGGGCIVWYAVKNGLELVRCETMGADNDGINGNGGGHITCRDCWSHDNLDDGESCHGGCFITQYGGLYEYNGSGCTPASGGEGMYYGTIARNNGYTGFSSQGVEAVMMCNGCLATDNNIGFNTGGNATSTLINCVSGDNTTNFNGGKRYNCVVADSIE